jgi:hypothetical protein
MIRQTLAHFVGPFATFLAFVAFAAPAFAAPHYTAEPLAPPAAERLIVRDLVWRCGAAGCATGKSNSLPATDCAALVRKVGPLRSFAAAGRAIDAAALEKCNARARARD